MDGLLIVDKPAGITSHDVVARVRRLLGTKRVGHTGTLDPFATGVMVILVGRATRLAQFLDKDVKAYEAVIKFGSSTDTGDRTGNVIDDSVSDKMPTEDETAKVLLEFLGEIEQTPPMFSAKKIDGRKLYEHARKGVEVERKPVKITIHELELMSSNMPEATIRVLCSAGTYIRTLGEDIGRRLEVGAHLSQLRRTRSGRFGIAESHTFETLENVSDRSGVLLPVATAVEHLRSIKLSPERTLKTRNGLSSRIANDGFVENEPIQMLDENGDVLAIGYYNTAENVIQPKIVLV